jgi:hypothetical protein
LHTLFFVVKVVCDIFFPAASMHHACVFFPLRGAIFCLLLFVLPPHTTAQWTKASLSQGRTNLASTSVGGLASFAGGANGTSFLPVVDVYNASSDSWSTASLSQARHFLQAASVDGLAIFAGGYNWTTWSFAVDIFNISATCAAVPVPMAVVAAEFNVTTPAITISSSQSPGKAIASLVSPLAGLLTGSWWRQRRQQGGGGGGQETQVVVDLHLVSLKEISPLDTVLDTIDLQGGMPYLR